MFRKKISITLIDYKRVSQYLEAGILKQLATLLCHDVVMQCGILADTWRNNDLIITSKRRFWCNDDVIFTLCVHRDCLIEVYICCLGKNVHVRTCIISSYQPPWYTKFNLSWAIKCYSQNVSVSRFFCCYRAKLWEKAQNWNTREKNIVEW